MREIKFRVWDKFNECYYYPKDFEALCNLIGILSASDNGYLLEQFVGLNDDNRKEIYEGDIIDFLNGNSQVVEWNDDICQFQFSDGSPINNEETYGVCKFVVGNIHENPELL